MYFWDPPRKPQPSPTNLSPSTPTTRSLPTQAPGLAISKAPGLTASKLQLGIGRSAWIPRGGQNGELRDGDAGQGDGVVKGRIRKGDGGLRNGVGRGGGRGGGGGGRGGGRAYGGGGRGGRYGPRQDLQGVLWHWDGTRVTGVVRGWWGEGEGRVQVQPVDRGVGGATRISEGLGVNVGERGGGEEGKGEGADGEDALLAALKAKLLKEWCQKEVEVSVKEPIGTLEVLDMEVKALSDGKVEAKLE